MSCPHFGVCGSCTLHSLEYERQLELKKTKIKGLFESLFEVHESPSFGYRARAEFSILYNGGFYAMRDFDKKLLPIESCEIVVPSIKKAMQVLREKIVGSYLQERLYAIEFLSSNQEEIIATLIYKKQLDEKLIDEAKKLSESLNINITLRAKGQKITIGSECVTDNIEVGAIFHNIAHSLGLHGGCPATAHACCDPSAVESFTSHGYEKSRTLKLKKCEGSFSQPNTALNQKMINWVCEASKNFGGDLLELYCGSGNFTVPLSFNFTRVLATEVTKSQMGVASENALNNGADNISFARLSSAETASALASEREFFRLKGIDIKAFDFSTIFLDPPRSGLDEQTLEFARGFENIIYISCNPLSLKRDFDMLKTTHKMMRLAMFDQFPNTEHIECGVVLKRI